jgi:hypothetical protein
VCMFHTLDPPVRIGSWACRSVYKNVPYKKPAPYSGAECQAVLDAVRALANSTDDAAHPLPGVYTWVGNGYRVDLRRWTSEHQSYLWAAVYSGR